MYDEDEDLLQISGSYDASFFRDAREIDRPFDEGRRTVMREGCCKVSESGTNEHLDEGMKTLTEMSERREEMIQLGNVEFVSYL